MYKKLLTFCVVFKGISSKNVVLEHLNLLQQKLYSNFLIHNLIFFNLKVKKKILSVRILLPQTVLKVISMHKLIKNVKNILYQIYIKTNFSI